MKNPLISSIAIFSLILAQMECAVAAESNTPPSPGSRSPELAATLSIVTPILLELAPLSINPVVKLVLVPASSASGYLYAEEYSQAILFGAIAPATACALGFGLQAMTQNRTCSIDCASSQSFAGFLLGFYGSTLALSSYAAWDSQRRLREANNNKQNEQVN